MNKPTFYAILFFYIFAFPFIGGCTWTPKVKTPIYSGSEGTIALITVSEETMRSNHPVTLDSSTLSSILNGIYIQHHSGLLQTLLAGKDTPTRVLTDAQVQFLTPHLLEAFSQVTAEEFVTFTLSPGNRQGENVIKGWLYKQGKLLVFTLGNPANPKTQSTRSKRSKATTTPSGLQEPTLTFKPEEALHNSQTINHGNQTNRLIINYEYMTKWSSPHQPKSSTAIAPQEKQPSPITIPLSESDPRQDSPSSSTHQGTMDHQTPSVNPNNNLSQDDNSNLNELRQQMQELNRELKSQKEEIQRLKNNPPTTPNP
jgi:hypothetical protein